MIICGVAVLVKISRMSRWLDMTATGATWNRLYHSCVALEPLNWKTSQGKFWNFVNLKPIKWIWSHFWHLCNLSRARHYDCRWIKVSWAKSHIELYNETWEKCPSKETVHCFIFEQSIFQEKCSIIPDHFQSAWTRNKIEPSSHLFQIVIVIQCHRTTMSSHNSGNPPFNVTHITNAMSTPVINWLRRPITSTLFSILGLI